MIPEEIRQRLEGVEGKVSSLRFEHDALSSRVENHIKENNMSVETLNRIEADLKLNTKQTQEMYTIFANAVAGLKVLGWIGRQIMRFIHFLGKIAKPAFYFMAAVAATYGFLQGKGWVIPAWIKAML